MILIKSTYVRSDPLYFISTWLDHLVRLIEKYVFLEKFAINHMCVLNILTFWHNTNRHTSQ